MANLVFVPIKAEIKSGTYLLYDCACGTGGMLTVAEETLAGIGANRGQQVKCLLYGQEINPETYAFCKADMLLNGEGESADHIVDGAEWSTLSHDAFPAQEFDFDRRANPASTPAACKLTEQGRVCGRRCGPRKALNPGCDRSGKHRIRPARPGSRFVPRFARTGTRPVDARRSPEGSVPAIRRSSPALGSPAGALVTDRGRASRGLYRRSSGSAAGFRPSNSCCIRS